MRDRFFEVGVICRDVFCDGVNFCGVLMSVIGRWGVVMGVFWCLWWVIFLIFCRCDVIGEFDVCLVCLCFYCFCLVVVCGCCVVVLCFVYGVVL